MMLGQIPGMKSMKIEEGLKQHDGPRQVGAKLDWLPTPDELLEPEDVEPEDELLETEGSCDGGGAWSQLLRLSARPLAKPDPCAAIEDKKAAPLCLEDCKDEKSHVNQLPLAIEDMKADAGSPQGQNDAPPEDQHDAPSEQVNVQPPNLGNGGPGSNEHNGGEPSPKRQRITKKTFAARYRPTGKVQGTKFDLIKESYGENIRKMIKCPSTHEDSFFKFCMRDLQHIMHVHQLKDEADVLKKRVNDLAVTWLEQNPDLLK